MMKERLVPLSLAVALATIALVACRPQPEPAAVEEAGSAPPAATESPVAAASPAPSPTPGDPVTLHTTSISEISTLDSQMANDARSIDLIENLFVTLTSRDPQSLEYVPEAATGWQVSEDGLVYTFELRTDIPWVRHGPETGETEQVLDEGGNPRYVTAYDFAYAIQRACDPNLGSYYSSVVAPLIKGCEDVLYAEDPAGIPPERVEAIGVDAPADDKLVIELAFPASYFESMTPMWTLAATPQWAIEEHGEAWIEPGKMVSNGRYVLHEWQRGVRSSLWRNPHLPQDLWGRGNVEQVVTSIVPDETTAYALWLDNEVDTAWIPELELEAHLEEFAGDVDQVPDLSVIYLGFALDKPPLDNVHVRRAFNAAFDRETFSQDVLQGQCLPMRHWAPPGIFGAPPIDEVGVGFDPEFAREQLSEAGYADCQGLPQISIMVGQGPLFLHEAEYAQAQWVEHLGCSPELIQIERLPLRDMMAAVRGSAETRPHMWLAGWGADYPDENNWVGDVIWCQSEASMAARGRECTELDDLIVEARQEPDPQRRIALYRQIEEGFFGPEGEMPFIPICVRNFYTARHAWLDKGLEDPFVGEQWYNWTIDWEAKKAAQGQ
jgi:oligopeptide transport system substrate-binding protein